MLSKASPRGSVAGFNYRRARGVLAENWVTKRRLAEASGLSYTFVRGALDGTLEPSEKARHKLANGMQALGINPDEVLGPRQTQAS